MSQSGFDIERLIEELTEHQRASFASLETLRNLGPVEVGQSPRERLFQRDKVALYHYPATGQPSLRRPLLIVYALVNRPYILDLEPGRSLIQRLQAQGLDLYLVDWGYPDSSDRFAGLEDYLFDYLHDCVTQVLQHSAAPQLDLLGVCQGGVLSLCYTAALPTQINTLTTLVTPVDFHTPDNLLAGLVRHVDIELAVETLGNIPGQLVSQNFNSLKPVQLGLQKLVNLPRELQDSERARSYLRMEKWLQDCPDQAGQAFEEFVEAFYQDNRLVTGGLTIGGREIRLDNLRQPILNIYGSQDHLVPPDASRALRTLTASRDYQEVEVLAGHIGVLMGRRSLKHLPLRIAQWLAAHPPAGARS